MTYSAAIESAASKDTDDEPSAFAARAMREATRRGFERAQRCVLLGDGAQWIWNVVANHFPDALQSGGTRRSAAGTRPERSPAFLADREQVRHAQPMSAQRAADAWPIPTVSVGDLDLDCDEDEEEWERLVMDLAAIRIQAARARFERLGTGGRR